MVQQSNAETGGALRGQCGVLIRPAHPAEVHVRPGDVALDKALDELSRNSVTVRKAFESLEPPPADTLRAVRLPGAGCSPDKSDDEVALFRADLQHVREC